MSPDFEPIAIVGRDVLFPGATSAAALAEAVFAGRDLVGRAPEGRWRVDRARALAAPGESELDRARTDRGGYVEGFEARFDPSRFRVPARDLEGLDPLFHWALDTARGALEDAGGPRGRTAGVMGLLSFPSGEMARFAEQVWGLSETGADPRNRFMSGLPALLLREALGLDAGAFALDAACASSLYAVKIACDLLHDDRADLVLAGAVNRADDLFIHVGFTALDALSPAGLSRPFHAEADGLVPAEGAGFVALCRYRDAVAERLPVYGVIRGVGLANDGRGRGLLAPSAAGQIRAMQAAFRCSGLSPRDVGLAECHATGTRVGDATELESLARVYAEHPGLPLGSIKSNLGHPITAAGVAGLAKILAAFERGERPPTLHVDRPTEALAGRPLRLLDAPEPFSGPRRAALSAFGFGGNDAHLLVEAPDETRLGAPRRKARSAPEIGVVALGACAGPASSARELVESLRLPAPEAPAPRAESVTLSLRGLRFPPKDLEAALPQQKAILSVLQDALQRSPVSLEGTGAGVYVGMGCDPEVARWGARWRLPGEDPRRDRIAPALRAPMVVGTMPNMPANRVSSAFDLRGPSFSVSAEERSGHVALELAARALTAGEIDHAVVGAADFSAEPVHAAALGALKESTAGWPGRAEEGATPGDGAAAVVLMRVDDARRAGLPVWAILETGAPSEAAGAPPIPERFGRAHAAAGLLDVAARASLLATRTRVGGRPEPSPGSIVSSARDLAGGESAVRLRPADVIAPSGAGRRLHLYEGDGPGALLERALREDGESSLPRGEGPRLVLAAPRGEARAELAERAARAWARGTPLPAGAVLRETPLGGELAAVFTGAGAAYPGMGRALLSAYPALGRDLQPRFRGLEAALGWSLDGRASERVPELLWGASAVCQLHAELSLEWLGLEPEAGIGYSSGESNALFAFGVWRDLDAMVKEAAASGLFTRALAGPFEAVGAAWGSSDPVEWSLWVISAPVEAVAAAVEDEPRAHLAIVHTDEEAVIAGEAAACQRAIARLGAARARPLSYPLAAHVPEVGAVRDAWWQLHARETSAPRGGARIYGHAARGSYSVGKDACADAITEQALGTIDFRAVVERAYADGVRVFLEHGPQGACTRWIRAILGPRPHLAVSLDRKTDPVGQLWHAAAELLAAGVELDAERLTLADRPWPERPGPLLVHPAHSPRVSPPPRASAPQKVSTMSDAPSPQRMAPAPHLPSVLERFDDTALEMLPAARASAPEVSSNGHAPLAPPSISEQDVGTGPAQLARHLERVAAEHRRFLASQAELQERFFASRAFALDALVRAARSATFEAALPPPEAAPEPPLPPPSALPAAALRPPGASPAAALRPPGAHVEAPLRSRASAGVAPASSRAPRPAPAPAVAPAPVATTPVATRPAPVAASTAPAPVAPAPAAARPAPAPGATPTAPAPGAARPAPAPGAPAPGAARPAAASAPVAPGPVAAPTAPVAARPPPSSGGRGPNPGGRGPTPSPTPERETPVGPRFDREALLVHASGRISEIFGPRFRVQDDFPRQVRMPEPPLLLADRVTGLDAELGSMGTGTIWTETDVAADAWYLHEGRMPAGVMIEAGQADLMLISWLGCDFDNRGERIYRLLGCDLTYHAGLPAPGDTLEYEIHVDGHAEQGPVRIFFFHYDGWIRGERRISVRGGQAGFFTDAELAASGGILWGPEKDRPEAEGRVDPPRIPLERSSFSAETVAAFSRGDARGCFGAGFERLATHTRTPRISGGEMVFFDEVEAFEVSGGPWGRGYLRARRDIRPDDWFFRGHFKNDPCMPGTLMLEGCLQTMAFYLTGLGYTVEADGWRFEPVPEEAYRLRCRGQVTPASRELVYEVFVEEVWDDPEPRLYAHLLCTVDGLKAFHAARMGLRLVPDWPLDQVGAAELARAPFSQARPPAEAGGVRFDLDAMLACALGRPSRAFGEMYAGFDGARKVPRLPGPPYHFMSRVVEVPPEAMGAFSAGVKAVIEYDVPPDAWYFEESGTGKMPFAVLLEAALQPCGWLASYIGSTLQVEGQDLFFRNLDGTGTLHAEVGPEAGILTTEVHLDRVAKTGSMIIVGFSVRTRQGDTKVYEMETVFGFFPAASLASQAGLPTPPALRERLEAPSSTRHDLRARPLTKGAASLSRGRLELLDEVSGWWPEGGAAGLGALRTSMAVDAGQWFFAAHFFQDPVQPGSLGIEAMLDALRAAALLRAGEAVEGRRFEALAAGAPLTWKYRGQVVPENERVEITLELTGDEEDDTGRVFRAAGSLWVDGKRIYEASGLAVRLVDAEPAPEPRAEPPPSDAARPPASSVAPVVFDPAEDGWLLDHRPTWTVPAVPMMVLVDRLAAAAGGAPLRLEDVRLRGWVLADRRRELSVRREGYSVALLDESGAPVIEARIAALGERPEPLDPPSDAAPAELPYAGGGLFHGPSFRVMTSWRLGGRGASATLERSAAGPLLDPGAIDPLLLDGGTHAIPHDRLHLWSEALSPDEVAYPARLRRLEIFGPPPTSTEVRVEARHVDGPAGPRFPVFSLQWIAGGRVWAEAELMEAAFPKGPIGQAPPAQRQAFLEGRFAEGVGLSRSVDGASRLDPKDVEASDWLPGTVAAVYGTTSPAEIVVAEHRARRHRLHPRAIADKLPCTKDPIEVRPEGAELVARSTGPSSLDLAPVERFWTRWMDRGPWPVEDVYYGLVERFVGRVVVEDPDALRARRGEAVLFLGNHQTMVESLLFSIVASALVARPTVTIAKAEHRASWLGTLIERCFAFPGVEDPGVITFFDRDDKASLPGLLAELSGGLARDEKAVMVHVEGTRALSARHRVEKMSGAFIDLAIQTGSAIVPVRFVGGLPVDPLGARIDFPVAMGKQDIFLGRPIAPEALAAVPYGPRKARVLEAMDALGGPREAETPLAADPGFAARVARARAERGLQEAQAVLQNIILERGAPRAEGTRRLAAALRESEPLALDGSAEDAWLGALARWLGA